MKNPEKTSFGNQLERIRISKNLLPEQVAALLGFKTSGPITQYEKGLRTPELKIALKLATIYNVPIRVMLDEYYEACREEVLAKTPKSSEIIDPSYLLDFCGFEEAINSKRLTRLTLTKVRRHSSDLIRKTAEKLGHI